MAYLASEITKQPHHNKGNICGTRPKYREGRKDTAVKVYTINQESCFLIIQNVPSVGAGEELKALCEQYGFLDSIHPLDEYPSDEFTEAYLVKYMNFPAARTAKKHLDDTSFFGGVLHVCYAPEFETIEDTKRKLIERRKFVAAKTQSVSQKSEGNSSTDYKPYQKRKEYVNKATCNINQVKKLKSNSQHMTYIWAGKEYNVPVASSIEIEEKNLEVKAELAVRQEQHTQEQNTEFTTQLGTKLQPFTQQQGIKPTSEFVTKTVSKTDSQQFVPRQLSYIKAQNLARAKVSENSKVSSHSAVEEPEEIGTKMSNYSYDETMNEIRKKLSSFTGANLTVNLRGKR